MIINRLILLLLLSLMSISIIAQPSAVFQMRDSVALDSLVLQLEKLTGERAVFLGTNPDTILSRHKSHPGNELAYQYIFHKLLSYDLQVDSQLFGELGKNILAVQSGRVKPEDAFIICAHYDGMPPTGRAPAADDNASGVAAVLEAARILSSYEFEYTIIYALWDEEEQGLIGSSVYAAGPSSPIDDILGVINLDVIGHDGNGDSLARIHVQPVGATYDLADSIMAMNKRLDIGLDLLLNDPGRSYSDHASFWRNGYTAVLLLQDWDNDSNPFYHTPQDKLEQFNLPYYEKMVKLAITSTAHMAVPIDRSTSTKQNSIDLEMIVFPNPVRNTLHLISRQFPGPHNVSLYSIYGQLLIDQFYQSGISISLDVSTIPAGIFILHVETDGQSKDFRVVKTS